MTVLLFSLIFWERFGFSLVCWVNESHSELYVIDRFSGQQIKMFFLIFFFQKWVFDVSSRLWNVCSIFICWNVYSACLVWKALPSKHTTSQRRRYNVAATSWRCSDVVTTFLRRVCLLGMFLKNRHFIIQERYDKLIYGINTIIKCGTWQSVGNINSEIR